MRTGPSTAAGRAHTRGARLAAETLVVDRQNIRQVVFDRLF
jgi:hypothetical protein